MGHTVEMAEEWIEVTSFIPADEADKAFSAWLATTGPPRASSPDWDPTWEPTQVDLPDLLWTAMDTTPG